MSYRFTNTDKWNDSWFCKLKSIEKLLFIYLCDNCDCAGFVEINVKKWAFELDENQAVIKGALKGLGRGLIVSKSDDCVYLKNFLKHQKNIPLNPNNKAHLGILKRFENYSQKFDIDNINEFIQAPTKPLDRGYGNGIDYIDIVISKFKEAYFEVFGTEYIVVNSVKDRNAVGSILSIYKDRNPTHDSATTSTALKKYFIDCCNVDNQWMQTNMSLTFIHSKFNEINNAINKMKAKNRKTDAETIANNVKYYNEISEKINNRDFTNYVSFLLGNNDAEKRLDNILVVEQQLSHEQFRSILELSGEKHIKLRDMLLSIDNKKEYTEGFNNLYTIINSWINRQK